MILPGLEIASRNLVRNIRLAQQQPCGIDLTLNKISKWNSAAILDFDNTKRKPAKVSSLPFNETITLQPGAYLVEFNETVKIPLNCMASVFPRSSLWRSGVDISSGVVDAGYEGVMGCLMDVKNPYGIVLYRGSKLAQIVFEEMGREVEGYKGIYQLSSSVGGQH